MAVTVSIGLQTDTTSVAVTQDCLPGIIPPLFWKACGPHVFVAGGLLSNAVFQKGDLYSLLPGLSDSEECVSSSSSMM